MWRLIFILFFASAVVGQTGLVPAANQPPAPSMTFDVASVRPVKMEPGHWYAMEGGFFSPSTSSHLTIITWGLANILESAFSVQPTQLAGYDEISPNVRSALYTIRASGDADADRRLAELPRNQRKAEQQHMLQALLIDRFHLKFHWEDRSRPGYRLVIDKRGSKLSPTGSLPMDADGLTMRGEDGKMPTLHNHRNDSGGSYFVGRGASLAELIVIISAQMGTPVQDATGLNGTYDFDLRYFGRTADDNAQEDPQAWPPMIDAIRDELGLRLEAAKVQQRTFVIDHMEAPSPN